MLIFVSLALLGALFLLFGLALLIIPVDVQRVTRQLLELMMGDRAHSFTIRGATVMGIVFAAAGSALTCIGLAMFLVT